MQVARFGMAIGFVVVTVALSSGCGGDEGAITSDDATAPSASSPSPSPSSPPPSSPSSVEGIPTSDPAALQAWLQTKAYQGWPGEAAPRPFTPGGGGHSGQVRTFLNPILDASMQRGGAEHPRGSASVKEFLNADGSLHSWAVSVKTEARSDGGKGWYWYEAFDTSARPRVIAGQGNTVCIGCHGAGNDFVRVTYPLR